MKVTKGVNDVKHLIPFMNRVFRKRFPSLLPKLYTTNRYADDHYFVTDKNKLVGALASIPNTLFVGDKKLNTRGIGMVSTHKRYRGKGIMSNMLKSAIKDAENDGVDYMFLSGNRQRYEHYGFVPAGYRYTYTLVPANFKYMTERHDYTFARLTKDSPYLNDVLRIYNDKSIRYDRWDFLKVVHSWNINKVYAILNSDNKVVGHLAMKWYKIVDFATIEPENTAYIVKAFAKMTTKFFGKIDLYPHMYEEIRSMEKYAQSVTIETPAFFKVLNYRNVIETMLYMDSLTHDLPDFDINVEIEGVDTFNVSSIANNVTVTDYKADSKTVSYRQDEASLALFSPSLSGYNGLPVELHLFVPVCDNV